MPISISAFFERLGYPLRNNRTSWGAERDGVVVLRTWKDETSDSPAAVRVLRPLATYAPGKRVGLRERVQQISHLWSGASKGYVVTATAKHPNVGARSIKSYDDTAVRPIASLFAKDGDIWARLGNPVPVGDFAAHRRRFRTEKAPGMFPVEEAELHPDASNGSSLEQRLRRFAKVEIRPHQRRFREAVFRACNGRCVISDCAVPEALEAAHLRGRRWKDGHNKPSDGILLRRDLHALYDSSLLSVTAEGLVSLDSSVLEDYGVFEGIQLVMAR